VVVYWTTNSAGFTLESAANLQAPIWTPIAGPYNTVNAYFEYSEPRAALSFAKFFRLHLTGAGRPIQARVWSETGVSNTAPFIRETAQ
jgi:hypothetical protein